ncbi:hypothetical protein ACO34A_16300 [Rhizobium sp. ACO-34A]|nr:hypothetical protein ACO34A_16300 [Rhizobium sp. ACO-34A]
MGRRWNSIKDDLKSSLETIVEVSLTAGAALALMAFAALVLRLVYFLKSGVWVKTACDMISFIISSPTCTMETSWAGLDILVAYMSTEMDASLAFLATAILLVFNVFVIGCLVKCAE